VPLCGVRNRDEMKMKCCVTLCGVSELGVS
jgi:hypothetical protein